MFKQHYYFLMLFKRIRPGGSLRISIISLIILWLTPVQFNVGTFLWFGIPFVFWETRTLREMGIILPWGDTGSGRPSIKLWEVRTQGSFSFFFLLVFIFFIFSFHLLFHIFFLNRELISLIFFEEVTILVLSLSVAIQAKLKWPQARRLILSLGTNFQISTQRVWKFWGFIVLLKKVIFQIMSSIFVSKEGDWKTSFSNLRRIRRRGRTIYSSNRFNSHIVNFFIFFYLFFNLLD